MDEYRGNANCRGKSFVPIQVSPCYRTIYVLCLSFFIMPTYLKYYEKLACLLVSMISCLFLDRFLFLVCLLFLWYVSLNVSTLCIYPCSTFGNQPRRHFWRVSSIIMPIKLNFLHLPCFTADETFFIRTTGPWIMSDTHCKHIHFQTTHYICVQLLAKCKLL